MEENVLKSHQPGNLCWKVSVLPVFFFLPGKPLNLWKHCHVFYWLWVVAWENNRYDIMGSYYFLTLASKMTPSTDSLHHKLGGRRARNTWASAFYRGLNGEMILAALWEMLVWVWLFYLSLMSPNFTVLHHWNAL